MASNNMFDTAANWEKRNPILRDGEIAIAKTKDGKLKFKIGNNSRRWSQLPFYGEDVENTLASKSTIQIITWEADD